jgi:hypothetical protein
MEHDERGDRTDEAGEKKLARDLSDSGLLALLTTAGALALAAAGAFFGVRRRRRQSSKKVWQRLGQRLRR